MNQIIELTKKGCQTCSTEMWALFYTQEQYDHFQCKGCEDFKTYIIDRNDRLMIRD